MKQASIQSRGTRDSTDSTAAAVQFWGAQASRLHQTLKPPRFCCVPSKLRALSFVEYDKMLMMDIDLAVIDCQDEFFHCQLPLPCDVA